MSFVYNLTVVLALEAFSLTYLWGWFLVPLGAPVIGFATALGLITIRMIAVKHDASSASLLMELFKEDKEKMWRVHVANSAYRTMVPLIALTIGYAAKMLM